MDEWQFRWVGVGEGVVVDWQSASKRFEMAVRPIANGKDSKISCHFTNAWYFPGLLVQAVMHLSCTLDQEMLELHRHEGSGANNSTFISHQS